MRCSGPPARRASTATEADRLVGELRAAGVVSEPVLAAVRAVPRERFVDPARRADAWANRALPIGGGQTISQPLVVARMCELLELAGTERALDVGTGSGYHAAVLARLAGQVWSVERDAELSATARASLSAAGLEHVRLRVGDGAEGWPAGAPFDAVNVACAAPEIPPALLAQLAPGGRLVAPVGGPDGQRLVRVRRSADGAELERSAFEGVRFVPLVS